MNYHLPIFILALGAVGCSEKPPKDGDVVAVTICPDGGCPLYADGHTPIPVRVTTSVPDDELATDLELTLQTSTGQWSIPSDADTPTATVVAMVKNSVDLDLIPGTDAVSFTVEGVLGNFPASDRAFLEPAPVGVPEVSADPAFLTAATDNDILLSIVVPGVDGGQVSAGTIVSVVAISKPANDAQAAPTTVVVDSTGAATAHIVAGAAAAKVSIVVTATPPKSANPSPPKQASPVSTPAFVLGQ
jgi:hypothetical protein